jgi:hypothetical protein
VPSTLTRRPLPALVSLLALLLLTALVWWRVLHRDDSGSGSSGCPTPTPSTSSAPAAAALPAPGAVTVQVLNSTNRTGIAGKARSALVEAGFKSPAQATNDKAGVHVKGVAEIRYGPAEAKAARLLSFYLPGAKLVANNSAAKTVVVSLGQKYKAVAPPATVATQLAKQHLTTESPRPTPASSPSC